MVFNSKNVVEVERIALKDIEDTKTKEIQKKQDNMRNHQIPAVTSYNKFLTNKDPTEAPDWKNILKHLIHITKDDSVISHYKN